MKDKIDALLDKASPDELGVVLFVCERLIGLGRAQYGPLNLANDERDFDRELDEELADSLVYAACSRLRRSRRG